jgi:hypothetical protein
MDWKRLRPVCAATSARGDKHEDGCGQQFEKLVARWFAPLLGLTRAPLQSWRAVPVLKRVFNRGFAYALRSRFDLFVGTKNARATKLPFSVANSI